MQTGIITSKKGRSETRSKTIKTLLCGVSAIKCFRTNLYIESRKQTNRALSDSPRKVNMRPPQYKKGRTNEMNDYAKNKLDPSLGERRVPVPIRTLLGTGTESVAEMPMLYVMP